MLKNTQVNFLNTLQIPSTNNNMNMNMNVGGKKKKRNRKPTKKRKHKKIHNKTTRRNIKYKK
jgi:hypothetical protein